jgi:hypothetical protein
MRRRSGRTNRPANPFAVLAVVILLALLAWGRIFRSARGQHVSADDWDILLWVIIAGAAIAAGILTARWWKNRPRR